jgi:hypothetical protein
MGLFSTVYNQCPLLGEDFLGELQTKDLENVMDHYWLSPDGHLYLVDWGGSFEMVENANSKAWYDRFKWEPTGRKGRLKPYRRSVIARMYPASTSREWKEVYVFFKAGEFNAVLPIQEANYRDPSGWT